MCSHPVGLGVARWARPGLRIVRRHLRCASQHAVACTRDVYRFGQAMGRSLSGPMFCVSVRAFSALAFVSLILGNSLREALSGTTRSRSHSGRPLSGVSPGGVLSCTELSRAAISVLISGTIADSSSALRGLGCSCLDARIVRIACSVCPHYLIAGVTGPPRR